MPGAHVELWYLSLVSYADICPCLQVAQYLNSNTTLCLRNILTGGWPCRHDPHTAQASTGTTCPFVELPDLLHEAILSFLDQCDLICLRLGGRSFNACFTPYIGSLEVKCSPTKRVMDSVRQGNNVRSLLSRSKVSQMLCSEGGPAPSRSSPVMICSHPHSLLHIYVPTITR
jgi:hypothetical protein